MVSKKVLEQMKAFVKKYDGVVIENDEETTFDIENDVVGFDCYQKNLDEGYDYYTDKYVIENDEETTFDIENDVVGFDCYQKNLDEGYDYYTDKYVLNIITYGNKYLKNKKLKKCTLKELLSKGQGGK